MSATPDLAHDPFERVVSAQLQPMAVRVTIVGWEFMIILLEQIGCFAQLQDVKLGDDSIHLLSSSVPALLDVISSQIACLSQI